MVEVKYRDESLGGALKYFQDQIGAPYALQTVLDLEYVQANCFGKPGRPTPLGDDLVAVSREGLVARSTDGTAWSWVGAVNQLNVVDLANDTLQTTGCWRRRGSRCACSWPRFVPIRFGPGTS